jgi:hypothetical protein
LFQSVWRSIEASMEAPALIDSLAGDRIAYVPFLL